MDKINSNLAIRSLLLAAVFGGLALPARAQAPASGCNVNLDQVRLANPLSHIAKKLVNFEPITIVGSEVDIYNGIFNQLTVPVPAS